MHDANDFVRAVQQVSTNANDAGYPATVMSGTVTSASPLKSKSNRDLRSAEAC